MATANLIQSSQHPPAQPSYILRGHTAQIHAVHLLRGNSRLLTGDAEGWVVLWSTSTKRATAVWKAHSNTILGIGSWADDKVITHGRDNKIFVWQLRLENEGELSKVLPVEGGEDAERKQPWLLHTLQVNALNFCAFAMCAAPNEGEGILLATPGVQDGFINVVSLPDEERIATIPSSKGDTNTGMIMALGITFDQRSGQLLVAGGYENGVVALWVQKKSWEMIYSAKTHSQPVLSLDIAQSSGCFFTSGADAIIARHPLIDDKVAAKTVQTKHSGQQGLVVRNDGKIFATAGWDGRVRVYSVKTMKELAVLKWHNEGCYALGFANVNNVETERGVDDANQNGGIVRRQLTVSQQREQIAKSTHWLAAGSKDGKVSLWDIY